jgi:predicted DNA-binding mobile mystery protein A
MSTRQVVALQYQQIVERASEPLRRAVRPNEGWLRTVRKALQMSGSQLARRLGVSRSLIYRFEKAELSGQITIAKLEELGAALNCRVVYGLVPLTSVEHSVSEQAGKKAQAYVQRTNEHMALEGQTLSPQQIEIEISRIAKAIADSPPRDLWDEDG